MTIVREGEAGTTAILGSRESLGGCVDRRWRETAEESWSWT